MYPPETPISAIFYPWKNRKFQIFKFFLSQRKNVSTCQWCKPEFLGLENLSNSLRKPFYEPHKNPGSIPHEPAKNCLSWDSNHSTRYWESDVLTTRPPIDIHYFTNNWENDFSRDFGLVILFGLGLSFLPSIIKYYYKYNNRRQALSIFLTACQVFRGLKKPI